MRADRLPSLLLVLTLAAASCSARDEELQHTVEQRLLEDHPSVRVSVDRQVVTLSGFLSSAAERSNIEATVRGIKGVRDIDDRLIVDQPPLLTADTEDAVEAASIASELAAGGFRQLRVAVHHGVVQVRGPVAPTRHAEAIRIIKAAAPKSQIDDETTQP
jgi:type IV pilus biogenesis protein CpaD/CtpE